MKPTGIKLLLFVTAGLILVQCREEFDPILENEWYFFSIYGYLDATPDTQWVRVMPVREALDRLPDTLDAVVTLEHMETGNTSLMHDSLFPHGQNAAYWNAWTTMALQPAHSYRLVAERSDGKSSHVQVRLPEDFPTPLVHIGSPDYIYIEEVEHLVDVKTIWHVRNDCTFAEYVFSFRYLDAIRPGSPGEYWVELDPEEDFRQILKRIDPDEDIARSIISVLHRQIFVASAGPDWLDFSSLDDLIIALPEGISNVENGVGYLVGIISKIVPYETCYDENGQPVGCPLERPLR